MTKPNPPRKHHFTPRFYLERWAGEDGRLEQYRLHGRAVNLLRVAPTATGFQDDLYAMPGLPSHLVQQVEERFMQQVDDQAAVSLAIIESGKMPATAKDRSAWTRFLQSLQLRTPADIAGIKERTRLDWGVSIPKVRETYESLRRTGDPSTFEEFLISDDPRLVERIAMRIATVLIDNPGIGELINNMQWGVIDVSASSLPLLTSDRGASQYLGLGDPRAFITVPIGPTRLFVAAHKRDVIDNRRRTRPRDIVMGANRTTVCLARHYVWANDRSQTSFIRSRFGSVHAPTLGERLAQTADALSQSASADAP